MHLYFKEICAHLTYGRRSHDATAACLLTIIEELHLQIEFKYLVCVVLNDNGRIEIMDWLLLFIGMTTGGGWTIHQTTYETQELCETAQTAIKKQLDNSDGKYMRLVCVQTQTDYGSMRSKRN